MPVFAEARVEDVGAVSGRGHPGGDDRAGRGQPERAPADVLTDFVADLRAVDVAGGAHAAERGVAARSDRVRSSRRRPCLSVWAWAACCRRASATRGLSPRLVRSRLTRHRDGGADAADVFVRALGCKRRRRGAAAVRGGGRGAGPGRGRQDWEWRGGRGGARLEVAGRCRWAARRWPGGGPPCGGHAPVVLKLLPAACRARAWWTCRPARWKLSAGAFDWAVGSGAVADVFAMHGDLRRRRGEGRRDGARTAEA